MTTTIKSKKKKAPPPRQRKKIDVVFATLPEDEFDQAEEQQGKAKHGLPWQAYAIVGSKDDPLTWKLPHHTRKVYRAIQGKLGYEHTVDWDNINQMVLFISRQGVEGQRVQADSDAILNAAHHLAAHFSKAGKPLPDALAVLV